MSGSFHPPAWKEMTNGGGRPHLSNGPQGGGFEGTTHYMLKKQQRHRRGSSSPMGRVILINAPVDGGENSEDIHTVTVNKSPDGRLGFSVRGGSEHGLGIFVSKVEHDSTAAQAGLTVGDKVLEVNGVSLESITMSSAVKVLTGHNRLRMVVRRVGKIPGLRYSKEKTTWVDLIHRRMVVEENGCTPSNASSDSVLRRIVHLFTTSDDYCLGFNIRGGKEFGLGIYVSKLDPGGLAEQHGIKMGDQILAANGVSFEDITHSNAVEVLKSHTHVMLTIREVGRYPAYKEMVAEYGWLDNLANGFPALSSLGSDTNSSVSSLSSSTPVSSLSGLSQVLFPPIFRSDVVDVGICTEDCSRLQSSTEKTADTAMQTDPTALDFMDQSSPSSLDPNQLVCTETSQTVGETVLLKDTVIRGKGEGPREMGGAREQGPGRVRTLSSGERAAERKYPKTEVLMALSKPQKPIRRSQSHITVSEKKKRGQQKEKGSVESKTTLQRSKTFVNLLFKKDHKEKSRSSSPSHHPNEKERGRPFHLFTSPRESRAGSPLPHHETLQHVEEMSKKLLSPDEVSAVMRHCRRFLSDNVTENLVRPLLAILDRPEKLLLLREIRTLIPTTELSHFDCLVMPFELEAYDFLKSRSLRSPALRSPRTGTPRRHLITPIPDYRGGFYLQPFHDSQKENQLIEDFERLRLASQPSVYLPPSRAFTHLLDVPVDSYASSTARSRTPSPSPSHSFLPAGSPHNSQQGRQLHHSPNRRETRTKRFDQASFLSVSDRRDTAPERGRSPVRNSDSRGRREGSPDSIYGRQNRQVNCTEVSVLVPSEWRERATPADVFDSPRERRSSPGRGSGLLLNGNFQNGQETRGTPPSEEYEISTLTISKAKQSLGISVSGGNESKIQPVIKIEKVFPGGAASTNEALKAGYELMSVDDVSLQGVTHQHAVDVIRRSFSNKGKDPMVFVVKVPKVSLGPPEL